jgi:plasmid stabilization system protein ParE
MMSIRFRKEAEVDLRGIVDWFEGVAPESVPNILSDIFSSIEQLTHYPRSGMRVDGRSFRRIVSLKYHFKIAYEIGDGLIIIIGIFRYQNRES